MRVQDLDEALRALVACVERDKAGAGILLPTAAALAKAKEVLGSYAIALHADGTMTDLNAVDTSFPTGLIEQLAQLTRKRYHAAMLDGLSEQAAFEEMIRVILETYRESKFKE